MKIRPLLFLPALLFLTGCATHRFPSPTPKWRTSLGQLQYVTPKRSVIGDTLVTRSGDQFQLEFTAGPGVSLMKLQIDRDLGRAESAVVPIPWQGDTGHAPKQLRGWVALRDVFSQLDAQAHSDGHTTFKSKDKPAWKADADTTGGRPVQLRVVFPKSREQFVFHFAN
jgi:hypothetical protein